MEWAARVHHEAQLHEHNCFVTLTYNDENLPYDESVSVYEHQCFMKRLRKAFNPGIRFFMCGEYGDKNWRPHYHYCLFGMNFPDKKAWKSTQRGDILFTSQELEKIWGKGFCTIGSVNYQSAAYIARYVMKKVSGRKARDHYKWIHPKTGEPLERTREFLRMSLRPGIGHEWFKRYKSDVYPHDFIVIDNRKYTPPRYYDKLYQISSEEDFHKLKLKREDKFDDHAPDYTPERLAIREQVFESKISTLKRKLEDSYDA